MAKPSFQAPPGTRDLYPADLLRRRYIEKLWRDTSIRHGFEEIDGPTFEHADLYAVKSGEGILNEVFQVFSGKDEAEAAKIRGGANAPYALRPEFTPTLARMYAAKAGSLPKPTKWFWMQNCYRAEKQQRGRLREFGQWNCDVVGGERDENSIASLDLAVLSCCADATSLSGLSKTDVRIKLNYRVLTLAMLSIAGVPESRHDAWFNLLDRLGKISPEQFLGLANEIGDGAPTANRVRKALGVPGSVTENRLIRRAERLKRVLNAKRNEIAHAHTLGVEANDIDRLEQDFQNLIGEIEARMGTTMSYMMSSLPFVTELNNGLREVSLFDWVDKDISIVRGLAYYTGMVFEIHEANGSERAIAGGGRYDNLIELFGGPPTPAVGFGMGDVVLSLVLQDRGLLPEGDALMDALSRPSASYRPDVFVIPAGQSPEDQDAAAKQVRPLVAKLRRGVESKAYLDHDKHKPWDANRYEAASGGSTPLHARSSSKATKNIGKLLQDAVAQKSKLAVILENAEEATIKDLRTNVQDTERTKIADLGRVVAERLGM